MIGIRSVTYFFKLHVELRVCMNIFIKFVQRYIIYEYTYNLLSFHYLLLYYLQKLLIEEQFPKYKTIQHYVIII